MSNTPKYKAGDVVNGHMLASDGTWVPVAAAPVALAVEPKNGLGIAALILGIIGLVSGLIPFFFWFAIAMGVVALVLGLVGRARVKRGVATNRKSALFGVLTGVGAIAIGIWGATIVFGAVNQLDEDLSEISNDVDAYSECVDALDVNDPNYLTKLEACDASSE
jgi:lysylphosphatidylglycerol synthetase-like protein (DUF2156 family)